MNIPESDPIPGRYEPIFAGLGLLLFLLVLSLLFASLP